MGHGQIPPEGKSEQKPNQSYVKLQELGAFLPFQETQIQLSWEKKNEGCFPSPACPFPVEQSLRGFDLTFGGGSAPLPARQGRCLQPHGDPGFMEVWDMDSREGWKAGNTSTTWHVLVHLCGRIDPLPASTCPSQPQNKHGVTPKPRGETNRQQTPAGLGLLHVTGADLCFVCCGSQA